MYEPSSQPRTGRTDATEPAGGELSRRHFMGTLGVTAALSGLTELTSPAARAATVSEGTLPVGAALRVKPLLVYHLDQRQDRTSWRSYGGLQTPEQVDQEVRRINDELKDLTNRAEYPIDLLPLTKINSQEQATAAAASDCDAFLVFGASGAQGWIETLAATKKPLVLFVRHKSGPTYLWYEIAHWRLLRKSEDVKADPFLDFDDVVVDDYSEVLWRLRALYGLKNARGTTMLALGGLAAYSKPAQELGPATAEKVWGDHVHNVTHEEIQERLKKARADASVVRAAEAEADALIAQPNVKLATDLESVVNTFLAVKIIKDMIAEYKATNVGVANCMGGLIPIFDTPPCLVLSLLNDAGYTAFCHTDFSHTLPGVLMRWISGKPSFVCNSHFPHKGMLTLAHCAAPRRMNGKDLEPVTLLTHFESDYGAATKVQYTKGQIITCIVPNLHLTKWFAFRACIEDSPAFDMCRSQMDIRIDGDWQTLTKELEGFHTVVTYGDYLREAAYAVKKVGSIEWHAYSTTA